MIIVNPYQWSAVLLVFLLLVDLFQGADLRQTDWSDGTAEKSLNYYVKDTKRSTKYSTFYEI